MANISILKPGLLTTIQDLGRLGYQQFGIPQSGAMDIYSLQLANLLVGNERYEACLEMTLLGPTIRFQDSNVFAITGADLGATLNGRPIKQYQTIMAQQGDLLEFFNATKGCRAYLAVGGGFAVDKVMGSKSTYMRGGFGGYKGRKLMEGDVLSLNPCKLTKPSWIRRIPQYMIPALVGEEVKTIRVITGPEEDSFADNGIREFFNGVYQITPQSDRMGFRLAGPKVEHIHGADIISGGINLGAIQIPGDGLPIIMLADRQTTGGYTKIAHVISIDLPILSQMKPGEKITFKEIDIEEAQALYKEREEGIIRLIEQLENTKYNVLSKKNLLIRVGSKAYQVTVEEIQDEQKHFTG